MADPRRDRRSRHHRRKAEPVPTHLRERRREAESLVTLTRCAVVTITYREAVKRSRNAAGGETVDRNTTRPEPNDVGESIPRRNHRKDRFVERWLDASSWSRRASTDNEGWLQNALDEMPRNANGEPPAARGGESSTALVSTVTKKVKTTASVRDPDFRQSLGYRNISIHVGSPSMELLRRAKGMITGCRASPELDDATARELTEIADNLQTENEATIGNELARRLIPALSSDRDRRLAGKESQLWHNAVPVPSKPFVPALALPLARPKPDTSFGYTEAAFTGDQFETINFLTDQDGQSYAVPDGKVSFPFLSVEIKSQANGGTHFIANNQAANAGSIALHGRLELTRRSVGVQGLDYDEPQFFSLSMDHESARINVHWLGRRTEDGPFTYHMKQLFFYVLNRIDDLRAVQKAVKNILDHALNTRLPKLGEALDVYREKILLERDTAVSEGPRASEVRSEPRGRHLNGRPGPTRRPEMHTPSVLDDEPDEPDPAETPPPPRGGRAAQGQRAPKRTRTRPSPVQRPERPRRATPSAQPVRSSARLATQARVQKHPQHRTKKNAAARRA